MARLFFDISDIVAYIRHHNSITGIQRATVMIISEALREHGPDQVYLSFLRPGDTTHLCCPAQELMTALTGFDTAALRAAFGMKPRPTQPEARFLDRYRDQPIKHAFHSARLRRALRVGDRRYLDKRGVDYDGWKASQGDGGRNAIRFLTLSDQARAGDVLCGLGALWDMPDLTQAFRTAHDRGLKVFVLVHDLIPMKLPELAHFKAARGYYDWLTGTPEYCSGYLANSESTARDLRDFLQEIGAEKPVHVTPLAQAQLGDVAPPAPVNNGIPAAHGRVLARSRDAGARSHAVREAALGPFALCVGTIEPRKNLWRLVQAWARLAQDPTLETPRLVLAGQRGWLTESFLETLARTGGLGGWVTYLEAPSDADLAYLYRNCAFTVMVSLYEGWGLPIGEGLSYGKTGVVSHTSSMPEVGGDMVEYCDPISIADITRAARRLIAEPEHCAALERRIADTRLRSWADVGRDVVAAITRD